MRRGERQRGISTAGPTTVRWSIATETGGVPRKPKSSTCSAGERKCREIDRALNVLENRGPPASRNSTARAPGRADEVWIPLFTGAA